MKYLRDYLEAEQTRIFDEYGLFFAFNKKQLEDGRAKVIEKGLLEDGEKLASLGSGAFVPEKNTKIALKKLNIAYKKAIEQDVKENGLSAIIRRELDNHEFAVTWDIEDTYEALSNYPNITRDRILEEIPSWIKIKEAREKDLH